MQLIKLVTLTQSFMFCGVTFAQLLDMVCRGIGMLKLLAKHCDNLILDEVL